MADAETTTKLCRKCGISKPIAEFAPNKRDRSKPGGRCKQCVSEDRKARWHARTPEQRERDQLQYETWVAANPDRLIVYNETRRSKAIPKRRIVAKVSEDGATKPCTMCLVVWPLSEFGPDKNNRSGLKSRCKECLRQEAAASLNSEEARAKGRAKANRWWLCNRDRARESARAWRQANPDKVKAGGDAYRDAFPERVSAYKRNYKVRKREAEGSHTGADILDLFIAQKGKCAYCRHSLRRGYHVDHIVPLSKGGTNDRKNLQLTCGPCNVRKKDTDPLDFARQIGRLL